MASTIQSFNDSFANHPMRLLRGGEYGQDLQGVDTLGEPEKYSDEENERTIHVYVRMCTREVTSNKDHPANYVKEVTTTKVIKTTGG